MDFRGLEVRRFVEPLRKRPQRIGAEAFGILVLLRDRGQGRSGGAPVVLFEFRCKLTDQCINEAPVGGTSRNPDGAGRDLRAEDKDALAMPNAGDKTDPMPFVHAAALVLTKPVELIDKSDSKTSSRD